MQIFRIPFKAMACKCEVVISALDAQKAQVIAQMAINEVHRVEIKYSRYRPDSVVSIINAAAGGCAIDCDNETWALFDYADAVYDTSDGLFDITAGVLRRAWNFNFPRLPKSDELASVCRLIAWPSVERNLRQVRLPQVGMEIDFGGFGKEYAADRAAAVLAVNGIEHGYMNLGGDMHVLGPKPDGTPWMIGILNPRDKNKLMATIPIEKGGLATSGDYERYFDLDGRRYCHILDPNTGQPVSHWRTISVVAPLTLMAGNCTTIAMLKQEAGLDYLDASGVDYLAMDQHDEIYMNKTSSA